MKKLTIFLFSTLVFTDFAWGMKWVRNSDLGDSLSIDLSHTYSDNSDLTTNNTDGSGNTEIRPSIGLKGYSRYVNVDLNYSVAASLNGYQLTVLLQIYSIT